MAVTQSFKDPTMILIMSVLLGGLGADRFMLGQIGLGILKLLTFGGLGFWTIFDWFTIQGKARNMNQEMLMQALA
jgi:TM2 domain-containing membrane protein YozV